MLHTNTEVLGSGLEERVLLSLGALAGAERSGGGLLTGGLGFGGLVIETDTLALCENSMNTAVALCIRSSNACTLDPHTDEESNKPSIVHQATRGR